MAIERIPNLFAFFHEELKAAFKALSIQTSEETEAYLVHLLEGFAKPDEKTSCELGFEKPAALLLEEAVNSPNDQKIDIYRRLGDSSLYSCGFFNEHLSQKSVGVDYYKRMGALAYQSLSDLMRAKKPGGVFDIIFYELAEKFNLLVNAFRLLGTRPSGIQLLQFGAIDRVHILD